MGKKLTNLELYPNERIRAVGQALGRSSSGQNVVLGISGVSLLVHVPLLLPPRPCTKTMLLGCQLHIGKCPSLNVVRLYILDVRVRRVRKRLTKPVLFRHGLLRTRLRLLLEVYVVSGLLS